MTSEEAESGPRQHSVKVPRLYKVASKLLKEHRQGGKSVKALSFSQDTRKKHPNVKGVFALLSESSRRERQLSLLIRKTGILRQETGLDEDLARVLLVELLFGKGKLPGGQSRPEQTVLKYEEQLRKLMEEGGVGAEEQERVRVPRYARVNTLKISLEAAISELIEEDGCEEVHLKRGGFVETASNLEEHQFVRDPLVPNLLAFACGTSFHGHRFYDSGKVLLQDRASCLPVAALRPPRDSVVLDACAAPGMKTTQLAAAVGRVGKVYAVERSKERADVLRKMLADSAADKVTDVVEANFLDLDPSQYQDVEHIVLDPSCSGSGMLQRSDTFSGERRLQSLSFVQAKLFKHALSFPNLKSMVYSTCSVFKEENEEVSYIISYTSMSFY